MNISSMAMRPPVKLAQTAPKQEVQTQAPASEQADDKVTWGDAAVGVAAGLTGGVVTGLGAGASAVKHSVLGTGEAYKALWTNETIGRNLKFAMGALLPIATIGVPVLAALGGAGYGLYTGFVNGVEGGFGEAFNESVEAVKEFDNEMAPDAREDIREFGEAKLEEGEEKFDVSPKRGVEAVAAGVGNTVVGGLGIGFSTLSQIPEAFITANRAIHQSDVELPIKVVAHVASVPLTPVVAGLGFVGGALFGLGSGAYHGYNEGFVDAFKKTGEHIGDYHKMVDKHLAEAAEDLAP